MASLRSLRNTGLVAILLLLVASFFSQTLAVPFREAVSSFASDSDPANGENTISVGGTPDTVLSCYPGSELQDLCERCAKVTKSVLAYPFCCRRRDNVHKWCVRFLSYKFEEK